MRVCWILLITVVLMVPIVPSLAKPPSVLVKSNTYQSTDAPMEDLEAMISGEHRGAEYAQSTTQSQQSTASNPTSPIYDPPYKNLFFNDTIFGDFFRLLDGDLAPSQMDLTWREMDLAGHQYLNISAAAKPAEAGRHQVKPILVDEPDF